MNNKEKLIQAIIELLNECNDNELLMIILSLLTLEH